MALGALAAPGVTQQEQPQTFIKDKNTKTNQEKDKEEEEHLSMGPGTELNPYNHTNGELKEAAATVPSPLPSQPQQKQSWFDGRTSKTRHPLIVGLIGEVEESMRLLKLRRDRIE